MRVALLALACACGRLDFDATSGDTSGHQRKPIAITPGATSLTDYPVSIVLVKDGDLAVGARPDGSDLAFTDADGTTPLDFEIEHYDGAGGLVAWVREPTLTGPTTAYLYFGGTPTVHDPAATWPGCLGVWHMSSGGDETDSTPHAHELTTASPAPPPGTSSGVAGTARSFDGIADSLAIPNPTDGSLDVGASSYSISMWVSVTTPAGAFDTPLYKGGGDDPTSGYDFELGTHEWRSDLGDGTTSLYAGLDNGTMFTGTWTQLVAVGDRAAHTLDGYANGVLVQSIDISAIGSAASALDLVISPAAHPFRGALDEVRIFDHAVDTAWVVADYENLAAPATFVQIGSAEPAP
ncbi:MAG TPA: LamG-like jellyroll fold domain-containing protein [Kofleriaceae bacterium]|nr:LamG-like jellyroll fold domain-containing protein [Kofleriaceae bacterium]